jgi:hypothetical protein
VNLTLGAARVAARAPDCPLGPWPPPVPKNATKVEELRALLRQLKWWNESERDADVMETIRRCRRAT